MGRKNKLRRFADLMTFSNVLECFDKDDTELVRSADESLNPKGQWAKEQFNNSNPIVLELACGKGEYTLGLAKMFPNKNFIGVDIKGNRIWKGAKTALELNLTNAAFLRTRIEWLEKFFGEDEIAEIWITFPDPFPRKSKVNRRLTSPYFLNKFRPLLQNEGIVHLKTDADSLFEFTKDVIDENDDVEGIHVQDDIYSKPLIMEELSLKTFYEVQHLEHGKTIKYVRLHLK